MNKIALLVFIGGSFLMNGLEARLQARSLVKETEEDLPKTKAEYDCNKGCDLTKKKVCGTDGITYYNECLAVCQVGKKRKEEPCCVI